MKICRLWDFSFGSYWIRSKRGWILLMFKILIEVWLFFIVCKVIRDKRLVIVFDMEIKKFFLIKLKNLLYL